MMGSNYMCIAIRDLHREVVGVKHLGLLACVCLLHSLITSNSLSAEDLVVDKVLEPIWGYYEYDTVEVLNGGKLTVKPLNAQLDGGWLVLVANRIIIHEGGCITATGAGYGTGTGGGAGVGQSNNDNHAQYISASGGGYGGRGGCSVATVGNGGGIYGSEREIDGVIGSAGGFYFFVVSEYLGIWCFREGGSGGGFIQLVADELIVNGIVSCNGNNGQRAAFPIAGIVQYGSGGGSGGELVLACSESLMIGEAAVVSSNGGDGSAPTKVDSSGGGGGGRIKVYVSGTHDINHGAFQCRGGRGGADLASGKDGTIHIEINKDCDFDEDGRVNVSDFAVLAGVWGLTADSPEWIDACDVSYEKDGLIDYSDLSVFAEHWLLPD